MRKSTILTTLCMTALAATLTAGPKAEADFEAVKSHLNERTGGKWTWVFYGDSITHGAAHTKGWRSFPEIFAERVRYELNLPYDVIINTGISGQTSVELSKDVDYEWRVRRFQPNMVLILIGSNDIVRPYAGDVNDYKARIEKLVDMVRADNAIPVLQTYPTIQFIENPVNDYYRGYVTRFNEFPAYNAAIRAVAAEKDTLLVDHCKYWEENASDPAVLDFWLGEPIHPGGKGHQVMAAEIFKALGAYSDASKCLTLQAGGEPPEQVLEAEAAKASQATLEALDAVELVKALKEIDSFSDWAIQYDAANGLPDAAWVSSYSPENLAIQDMDGKPALVARNLTNTALITWKDKATMGTFSGILRIDAELALLGPANDANFYLGMSAGPDDRPSQPIIALGTKSLAGSHAKMQFNLNTGKFIRMTILVDMNTGHGLCRVGNHIAYTENVQRLATGKNNFCYFGDGGSTITGSFALRYLHIGAK